jgi:transcriptional regulator with XRE-family HTH domain
MGEVPDLAALLRSWRARIQHADVGIPFGRNLRRTPGLRREEVAWLAGVSPDYVKRLEQVRAHPSPSVLRALSKALRLSDAEYELACRLAGYAADLGTMVPQHIGPSVQRILDRFPDSPIAVFDAAWTLLEHNEMWTALTGDVRGRGGRPSNLVWRVFTGDVGWVRHPAMWKHKDAVVADLRDVASRYPADHELTSMISALRASNPEFALLWERSSVAHHGSEKKTVVHPEIGELELDCDVLSVRGADLRIIVFTAEPRSEAADKLRLLAVLGTEAMTPPQT